MLYDIFVNLLASLVWFILAWLGARLYKRIKQKHITKTGNTALTPYTFLVLLVFP